MFKSWRLRDHERSTSENGRLPYMKITESQHPAAGLKNGPSQQLTKRAKREKDVYTDAQWLSTLRWPGVGLLLAAGQKPVLLLILFALVTLLPPARDIGLGLKKRVNEIFERPRSRQWKGARSPKRKEPSKRPPPASISEFRVRYRTKPGTDAPMTLGEQKPTSHSSEGKAAA